LIKTAKIKKMMCGRGEKNNGEIKSEKFECIHVPDACPGLRRYGCLFSHSSLYGCVVYEKIVSSKDKEKQPSRSGVRWISL
jgi:hypothetical protein